MVCQDGCPLRFGGVRGEHKLDAHIGQFLCNLFRCQPTFSELTERISPKSRQGVGTGPPFDRFTKLIGRVLFSHSQQLKRDRVGLSQMDRIVADLSRYGPVPQEWQRLGEITVPGFLEHRTKAFENPVPLIKEILFIQSQNAFDNHDVANSNEVQCDTNAESTVREERID